MGEAEPALIEATNALKTLQIDDFVVMKSYTSPPLPVKLVMEAVCIMLDRKPNKKDGKDDYWEQAKKVLADPKKFI